MLHHHQLKTYRGMNRDISNWDISVELNTKML